MSDDYRRLAERAAEAVSAAYGIDPREALLEEVVRDPDAAPVVRVTVSFPSRMMTHDGEPPDLVLGISGRREYKVVEFDETTGDVRAIRLRFEPERVNDWPPGAAA